MLSHAPHNYQKLNDLIQNRMNYESSLQNKLDKKYLTDFNFADIKGKTLLHYACEMGDIEEIQYCLENGADINLGTTTFPKLELKPIEIALNSGHLEAAIFLFNKNADCSNLPLAKIKNEEGREWYRKKIEDAVTELVNNNFRYTIRNNFFPAANAYPASPQQQPQKFIMPSIRIAELNNLDLLDEVLIKNARVASIEQLKEEILLVGAANGHEALINRFKDKINPKNTYAQSALHLAAQNDQLYIIDHLLKLGADINKQNTRKNTPLMEAVINGNVKVVSALLNGGANIYLKNVFGQNALHLAVQNNQIEIVNILLKHLEDKHELLEDTDHYGFTAMDVALISQNDEITKALAQEYDKSLMEKTPSKLLDSRVIHQKLISNKILYFLNLNYRDTSLFSDFGYCAGLGHLYLYYASQGRSGYFLDTLRLMSSWDGSEKSLYEPLTDCPQAKYYKNLYELFEQWINDITWFTQLKLMATAQHDRFKQHRVINHDAKDSEQPYFIYSSVGIHKKDAHVKERNNFEYFLIDASTDSKSIKQLKEILKYLIQMPPGICIELYGNNHSVCIYINEDGSLSLYDSNAYYKLANDDFDSLFNKLIDLKYILPMKIANLEDKINPAILVYTFKNPNVIFSNDAVMFPLEHMPKTKQEAEKFRNDSLNKFSRYHIAVITRNVAMLKQLIESEDVNINLLDINGNTALYLAVENNFTAGLDILLQSKNIEIDHKTAKHLYATGKRTYIEKLSKAQDADLKQLLYEACRADDSEIVKIILSHGKIDVNDANIMYSLLDAAISRNQTELVNTLLSFNVSVDMRDPASTSDCTILSSSFDSAIQSDIFLLLLSKSNKDINCKYDGSSLLHRSTQLCNLEIMTALLKNGADPSSINHNNNTPLDLLRNGTTFCNSRETIDKGIRLMESFIERKTFGSRI